MALLSRKLHSVLVSSSITNTSSFAVTKTIIIPSQLLVQSNNDSNVSVISDLFKKTHNWDTLTRTSSSVQLTHSLVQQVLLQLKMPELARSALNFFYWSAKTQNFQHQIDSYCIAIHIVVHAQQLAEAKILIQSALKTSESNSTRFCLVESLLGSYKVVDSSPLVFDLLVQAYAKLRMFEDGFEVSCYLENHGFCLNLSNFNALFHGCKNLVKMQRKYPNEITVRTMIGALCKEGKLQVVVNLLDRIHGKRCSPIVFVNTNLVFKVIEKGRIEEGVELLKRMLQKNLILDTIASSFIVYTKLKLGNLESAWELYDEMLKRDFSANSFLFSSFIKAYCERGKIQEAESMLQEMKNMGLKPYDETFNHLIEACAKAGELDAGVKHFEEMIGRGLVPSCSSFNEMVRGLCEIGNSEKANEFLTLVLDKGLSPNEFTCIHLMSGYGKQGKIQQEAEKYLRIMKGRSIGLSEEIYEALITGYLRNGDKTRAALLHNEMVARGMKTMKII
ncbi:hypothetical protein ES319_D05G369600v1 [Gossypium barbadense]|uniref:Pentacotripeptide-repeat region of PRORP domain-containing protein n=1 Tax=Gossypium barbadense TaxID=3634 RepID=A0A5J5RM00_GOSBA|nr:hypothetical protein ES319_D05G369600v1 [Gossypium barbadense]